jgi:hypothetical protein
MRLALLAFIKERLNLILCHISHMNKSIAALLAVLTHKLAALNLKTTEHTYLVSTKATFFFTK